MRWVWWPEGAVQRKTNGGLMASLSPKLESAKGTHMDLNKVVKISGNVGVSICRGEWQTWYGSRDQAWHKDYNRAETSYVLDFCALHLKSTEAFILAVSNDLHRDMETFDDEAVLSVIRQANLDWEFVE